MFDVPARTMVYLGVVSGLAADHQTQQVEIKPLLKLAPEKF